MTWTKCFHRADGLGPIALTLVPIPIGLLFAGIAITQGLIQKYGFVLFFRICFYLLLHHK